MKLKFSESDQNICKIFMLLGKNQFTLLNTSTRITWLTGKSENSFQQLTSLTRRAKVNAVKCTGLVVVLKCLFPLVG